MRAVAALDEDDEWNPLAAARRRGEPLARVFGGAPGSYGARLADRRSTAPGRRATSSARPISRPSHAYGARRRGAGRSRFRAASRRPTRWCIRTTSPSATFWTAIGVADAIGGFAAAARCSATTPALYSLDTSQPGDAQGARACAEEIARVVRGRLTNPRWIAGMLRHGHRGVAEIAQGVDALYAFAATTRAVPDACSTPCTPRCRRRRGASTACFANPAAARGHPRGCRCAAARAVGQPPQLGRGDLGEPDSSREAAE